MNRNKLYKQWGRILGRLCGEPIVAVEHLAGGYNSFAVRVLLANGRSVLAKRALNLSGDRRPRLQTEFTAFSFLWKNGIRCVPEPLKFDIITKTAVYSYIEGQLLSASRIRAADIRGTAHFYCSLRQLAVNSEPFFLPLASEACLSLETYIRCIERRWKLLRRQTSNCRMQKYLNNEWRPIFDSFRESAYSVAKTRGWSLARRLAPAEKTLSPSDVGFHNVLRAVDGKLFFIDFEYFGWDDPVKLIADFLWQPRVKLSEAQRLLFTTEYLSGYPNKEMLLDRLAWVFPFVGLKWALIMLNPLLPAYRERGTVNMTCYSNGPAPLESASRCLRLLREQSRGEEFPWRWEWRHE